jgi:L,D-transpeptidase catalytic domain
MKSLIGAASIVVIGLAIGEPTASANVVISVNKTAQRMSVSVDGVQRYRFAVSTARAGYSTPNGTYHPQRMERSWFSREYYNSPMPYSIFFHGGYAIHGSYEINRLGGPASHGCIRLHPSDAAALFAVVRREGMAATTIEVSGRSASIERGSTSTAERRSRPTGSSDDESYSEYGSFSPRYRPPGPGTSSFFAPF